MPAPSTPARYPKGVTNVSPTDPFHMLGRPDPTKFHEFFQDFNEYLAADWVITVVEAGAGSNAIDIQSVDGGVLRVTTDDADNDGAFFQWAGRAVASTSRQWTFEAGVPLWYKARFSIDDATESDFVFGLQVNDTTPLAVANGVFFRKLDGTTAISLVSVLTTETTVVAGTLVSGVMTELAFYWDGATLHAYQDGRKTAVLVPGALIPVVTLCVSFGVQNGSAAARILNVDYIYVAKQRSLY